MNIIRSDSVQGRGFVKGFGFRLAAIALGAAFFLSANGNKALAQSGGMTQLQYLQWVVQLSGESLGKGASANAYVAWAKARGMLPTAGWKPGDKLSKEVMAQTLAQLLNIVPRKKIGNYVILLAQNGIHLSGGDKLTHKDVADVLGNPSFIPRVVLSPNHPGHQNGNGHENHNGNGQGHEHHDHDGDGLPDNPHPGQGPKAKGNSRR